MDGNKYPNIPNRLADFSTWFQRLHEKTLSDIWQNIQHKNHIFSLQLKDRQRQDEEARQLLKECGLDLGRLDKMEAEEERLLDHFLQQVRSPLATHSREQEVHLQMRGAQAVLYPHMGQPATLLGADVATNLRHSSEPTFVLLYDAEEIKDLKNTMTGSGWGCFVKENPAYPDAMAIWWYLWVPPEHGTYWFWVVAPYSGFYIIRANDKWHNCKYAKAHAFYEVDVYQYFWRGPDVQTVIDKRGSNINETGLVSGSLNWLFSHPLHGGDPIGVRITVTLDVYAQGSGDYAELNFSDGEGNYLGAPVVFISKD